MFQALNQALSDQNECFFPQLIPCLIGNKNSQLNILENNNVLVVYGHAGARRPRCGP